MLCENCTQLFAERIQWKTYDSGLGSYARGLHQQSLAQLKASAADACFICAIVLAVISQKATFEEPLNRQQFTAFELSEWSQRLSFTIIASSARRDLIPCQEPFALWPIGITENPGSDPPIDTPSANTTSHPEVLRLARKWLNQCLTAHPECQPSNKTWFPPRLIDISRDGSPRLILTDIDRPLGCYATLSHCWGTKPTFYMLTQWTLEAMLHDIPVIKLAQNFQDAIFVARELKFRYLWIDSLCIMQDGTGSAHGK
jgi:hypothetical protein